MSNYSIPLEFKLVERETPAADASLGTGTMRRGKIKEDQLHSNRWLSTWIPWDDQMDMTTFLRNLQRELAAVGLAATRDVERNMRARIDEYKIFSGDISSSVLSAEGNSNNNFMIKSSSSLSGAASAASSVVGPVSSNGSPSSSVRRSKRRKARGGFDDDDENDSADEDAENDEEDDDEVYSAKRTTAFKRGRKRKQPSYSATSRPSSSSLHSQNVTSTSPVAEVVDSQQQRPPLLSTQKIKFQCAACDGPLEPGIQTCPQCGADAMPKPGSLGKGKKLCRSCKGVLASFRRECTHCHAPCGKGD